MAVRRHLAAACVAVALAGSLSACAPSPVSLAPVSSGSVTDDYDDVVHRWTRATETYSGFESVVSVSATYFGPELVDAWALEEQRAYGLDGPSAAAARTKIEEDTARTHRFFLAVFTNEMRWNDLDKADPAFRLWLSSDMGPRVAPASIERVRDRNDTLRRFFPSLGHFREGYIVRFPVATTTGSPTLPSGTRSFALELTGPHGDARLTWEAR